MATVRIGISGWTYKPWRGVFYPRDLPQRRELEFASRQLPTIEINGSFYSLQKPESYRRWKRETPPDFVFSVKASRYITHLRRLKDVEKPLANFFASGVLLLDEKLGPFLWQLPPNFRYDPERLESFFAQLPRSFEEAAALARRRDDRMKGRSGWTTKTSGPLRHALEFRNESFLCEDFVELLRRHNIALAVSDAAADWPCREDVTADFVYARLHGAEEMYASGYTPQALERWAAKVKAWKKGSQLPEVQTISQRRPRRKGRDVYLYFDNDAKVKAPFDARSLIERLEEDKP